MSKLLGGLNESIFIKSIKDPKASNDDRVEKGDSH
jgi:hypothetical protein